MTDEAANAAWPPRKNSDMAIMRIITRLRFLGFLGVVRASKLEFPNEPQIRSEHYQFFGWP